MPGGLSLSVRSLAELFPVGRPCHIVRSFVETQNSASMPQVKWNDLKPLPEHPEPETPVKPTDADHELKMIVRQASVQV